MNRAERRALGVPKTVASNIEEAEKRRTVNTYSVAVASVLWDSGMSKDDVRTHAKKYSKAYSNGPWQTNFEEMAKKTVLKRVLKYAPLKTDFVRGLTADETIKTQLSDDMFSVPDETVIEAEGYEVDETTGEVKDAVDAAEQ